MSNIYLFLQKQAQPLLTRLVAFVSVGLLAFGSLQQAKAQYTTTHYVAPSPWSYFTNANELVVTTLSTSPVVVTIKKSDGTLVSNSLTTVAGSPLRYRFSQAGLAANPTNTILNSAGLIVSALTPIGLQIRNIASDYVGINASEDCKQKGNSAFTSMGDQGLGTSFRIGYYAQVTGNSCFAGETGAPIYSILAKYNSTTVTLNGNLVTTLNAGQSYLLQAPMGSLITTNKNVVVNSGMRVDNSAGCGDGVASQVLPVNLLGTSYIVVRSGGNNGYEKSTIIASEANTTVQVTITGGATTNYTLANAGDFVTINNGDGSTQYSSCAITASKPVEVFTGSASGCEIDMIVQPPLSVCSGSFDVQTYKFLSFNNTQLPYFGYILVQSPTEKVYFNEVDLETIVGNRQAVGNTGFFIIRYTNSQLGNPSTLRFNVNARINVALVESGGGFSMSSFISSFASNTMPPPSISASCLPATFTAQSGFSTYYWYKNGELLDNVSTRNFTPTEYGSYSVSGVSATCGITQASSAVTVNPRPSAGADQTICAGNDLSLTGSMPAGFTNNGTWVAMGSNPTGSTLGNTVNGTATINFDQNYSGLYQYIYNAGCTDTVNITVKAVAKSITNASICPGGFYLFNGIKYTEAGYYGDAIFTAANGCDSIAYLDLTVKKASTSNTKASICPGGSYTFNGTTYTSAGTYTAKLTNAVGCDSIATLILTIKATSASTTNASICAGSSYTFNGTTYTSAGTYTAKLTNAVGCDSIATLILTIKATSASTTNASICAGGSYTFNGTTYTSAGTYTAKLTNAVGCDSTATLILTVKATSASTTNASICAGGSYAFNGTTYTSAGTYTAKLTNAVGCDSIATLILTVKATSASTTNASICAGGSYAFNGTTYTSAGTYTAKLTNAVGCDSIATLILTVKATSASTTNASICAGGSYTFNGTTYTSAGTYTAKLTNAVGCDSTATLILTVKATSASTTNASICAGGSYAFNGTTYTSAGTYTAKLTNAVGCDSIATLILTVKATSASTTNASICTGGSYTFNGTTYTSAGTYTAKLTNAVGCDSIATLILTIKATSASTTNASICAGGSYTFNGTTYTSAGTYTVKLTNAVGCDSIATLILTVNTVPTPIINNLGIAALCAGSTNKPLLVSSNSTGNQWLLDGAPLVGATKDTLEVTQAGSYTVISQSVEGCFSLAAAPVTIAHVAAPIISGPNTVCLDSSIQITANTNGGFWNSNDTTLATISQVGGVIAKKVGHTAVVYTVTNSNCVFSVLHNIQITDCSDTVSSGITGGLESKSLGFAVANRVYQRTIEGIAASPNYVILPAVQTKINAKQTLGSNVAPILSNWLPSATAIQSILSAPIVVYNTTPKDLENITNAQTVIAQDYTINNQCKAVAFAVTTNGMVYSHTKSICDRLKGASLQGVTNLQVNSYTLLQFKLRQANGTIEYFTSFSASKNNNSNLAVLQSNWINEETVGYDVMHNFQLWASTPSVLQAMATDALNKISNSWPMVQINHPTQPKTYIVSHARIGKTLQLVVANQSANTAFDANVQVRQTELSSNSNTVTIPISVKAFGTTTVNIDMADAYEAQLYLSNASSTKLEDVVYSNDGTWNHNFNAQNTTINSFSITNDTLSTPINEYRLFRNVRLAATTNDYVSIYKLLKAAGTPLNLTAYKGLKFTATTYGAGSVAITLVKNNINSWQEQYSLTLPLQNGTHDYTVSLSDFAAAGIQNLTADDITTINFAFSSVSMQRSNVSIQLNNVRFTKYDDSYLAKLTDKTVTVAPNPIEGNTCTIRFKSAERQTLQLLIVETATGKVTYRTALTAEVGNNQTKVTLPAQLAKGSYKILLQNNSNTYTPANMLYIR